MKFPITRAELKGYLNDTYRQEEKEQRKAKVLEKFKKEVTQAVMACNSHVTLNTWYLHENVRPLHCAGRQITSLPITIEEIVEDLKLLFIDCDIQVAPARDYIYISWA